MRPLKLPDLPELTEEQDRQRYLGGLEFRRFMISSLIAALAAVCLSIFVGANIQLFSQFIDNYLSVAWPGNSRLLQQLSIGGRSNADQHILVVFTSITSAIWLVWLMFRVIVEITRTDAFLSRVPIYIIVIVCLLTWWAALSGLSQSGSLWQASLQETELVAGIKKGIWISDAYWMIGLILCFGSPRLRALVGLRFGNSRGSRK